MIAIHGRNNANEIDTSNEIVIYHHHNNHFDIVDRIITPGSCPINGANSRLGFFTDEAGSRTFLAHICNTNTNYPFGNYFDNILIPNNRNDISFITTIYEITQPGNFAINKTTAFSISADDTGVFSVSSALYFTETRGPYLGDIFGSRIILSKYIDTLSGVLV